MTELTKYNFFSSTFKEAKTILKKQQIELKAPVNVREAHEHLFPLVYIGMIHSSPIHDSLTMFNKEIINDIYEIYNNEHDLYIEIINKSFKMLTDDYNQQIKDWKYELIDIGKEYSYDSIEFENFLLDLRDRIEYLCIAINYFSKININITISDVRILCDLDSIFKKYLPDMMHFYFKHGLKWNEPPQYPSSFWWRHIPYEEYILFKQQIN